MNGSLICITGIDGAGKSTQAQRLVVRLRQAGYSGRYVWGGRRAMVTAPFVRGGKRLLHAPPRPKDGMRHENSAYRRYIAETRRTFGKPALRAAWRILAMSEHVVQLLATVELPLLRGEIVVCDRYVYDTLISQMALFGLPAWQLLDALHRPLLHLLPQPMLGFWLDIPPSVAMQRKTDIYDLEQLNSRAPLYAALADALGFTPLDATCEADATSESIWSATEHMLVAHSKPATLKQVPAHRS